MWIMKMDACAHQCKNVDQLIKVKRQENETKIKGYIPWSNNRTIINVPIENVQVRPEIEHNILSLKVIMEKGFNIIYRNDTCEIYRKGLLILSGTRSRSHQQYIVNMDTFKKRPTTSTIPSQEHGKLIDFEQFNSVMKSFDERLSREEENRVTKSNEMQKQMDKLEQQVLSAEKMYFVQQKELIEKDKELNDQLMKVNCLKEIIYNLLPSQRHAHDLQCDLINTEKMVNISAITAIEKRNVYLQNCFGNLKEQQIVECLEIIEKLNCKQEGINVYNGVRFFGKFEHDSTINFMDTMAQSFRHKPLKQPQESLMVQPSIPLQEDTMYKGQLDYSTNIKKTKYKQKKCNSRIATTYGPDKKMLPDEGSARSDTVLIAKPILKFDVTAHFRCLNSELALTSPAYGRKISFVMNDYPEDRQEFFNVLPCLSHMDNLSKKEKKQLANDCNRQPSTREKICRNQLNDVIWLFPQISFVGQILEQQDQFICIQRQAILEEITQFHVKTTIKCKLKLTCHCNDCELTDLLKQLVTNTLIIYELIWIVNLLI